MFINPGGTAKLLVTHLIVSMAVHARPCSESGDFEQCVPSKTSLNDEEVFPDIGEQFTQERTQIATQQLRKYDFMIKREAAEDKNCSSSDDDVVDREDHVTQYLSELLVNTDSEITSLQASDVEEIREESASGSKDEGYFAFLTGDEMKFEVDGAWSRPAKTIVEEGELAR